MDILVIDVGGTHVKLLVSTVELPREFDSGPTMTAQQMVDGVKRATEDWKYDVISMGYPGPVLNHRPVSEPANMGKGWVGFDFQAAFGKPVKILNDAAMQALGSYDGGRMLFLGFGTGLGSAMIADGLLQPMELGHLPYRKGTFEDYVGQRGLLRLGKKKWRKRVFDVVERMIAALEVEYVVLGGGNVRLLKELPPKCREGANANAFVGGIRLWDENSQTADSCAIPIATPAVAAAPAPEPAAVPEPAPAPEPAASLEPAEAPDAAAHLEPAQAGDPAPAPDAAPAPPLEPAQASDHAPAPDPAPGTN